MILETERLAPAANRLLSYIGMRQEKESITRYYHEDMTHNLYSCSQNKTTFLRMWFYCIYNTQSNNLCYNIP